MKVNSGVLTNLCARLIQQDLSPRIIAVSTGAIYESHQSMPLIESSELQKDSSPYVESKFLMEKNAADFRSKGLNELIVARPFNHIGPGQGPGFILPDMYKKLSSALGLKQVVKTGNINTRRDYTDVRDVIRAYSLLLTTDIAKLTSPVYNILAGVSHSGEEIIKELVKQIPGSENIKIERDPSLIRPNDPKELFGSNELIHAATGWQPTIALSQTVSDFVGAQNS